MTRAMSFDAHVPTRFWLKAVAISAYLLNRLPSQTLNHKTPLQILATQTNIPPIQMLTPRVFGCSVFVHIPKANRTKFDSCAKKCVFVGYATHQKGYQCYNPITHRVYVTMDCDFLESEYFFSSQLGVQREKTSEPPSWLSNLSCQETVPKEQVDGANEHVSVNVGGTNTTNEDPSENVQQEVSDLYSTELSPVMNEVTNNDRLAPEPKSFTLPTELSPVMNEVTNNDRLAPEPEPFTVPPRRIKGVPPDRYSPEHVSRKARYPMKITKEGVTDIARAFFIPKTVHEASKKDEWQEAMKTKNLVQHDKTKHVEVDKHSIKEKIEDNNIELPFVKSEDQLADIFTKAVTGKTFTRVLSKLSIGDPTAHLEGEC